ncbi:hypothetical protein DFH09DRAFT_1325125 [Mycena vulgaris]|nr:hypothetical protein DFH09DRAFT_1325125 [Mycena vulgaris]
MDGHMVESSTPNIRIPSASTTPPRRLRATSRASNSPPQRRAQRPVRRDSFVTLTCGAERRPVLPTPTDKVPWGSSQKRGITFLPLPLEDPRLSQAPPEMLSTGCGAIIHTRASPRGSRTWTGCSDAAGPTAVPLASEYFTDNERCHLGGGPRKEECGCKTIGVGCCVCGNTLGVHRTLCRAHRSMLAAPHPTYYTFLTDAVSPPVPRRSKIPITIERSQSRTPTRTNDPLSLTTWLSQARERQVREPSPTRSEMDGIVDQVVNEIALEEGRFRLNVAQAEAMYPGPEREELQGSRRRRHSSSATSDDSSPGLVLLEDPAEAADTMSDVEIVAWTLRQSSHRTNAVMGGGEAGSVLFGR